MAEKSCFEIANVTEMSQTKTGFKSFITCIDSYMPQRNLYNLNRCSSLAFTLNQAHITAQPPLNT